MFRPEFVLSARLWMPKVPPAFLEVYQEIPAAGSGLRVFARKDVPGREKFKIEPLPVGELQRVYPARAE